MLDSKVNYFHKQGLYHICVSNYQQALKNLNDAIENDSTDIRAYLYRGKYF